MQANLRRPAPAKLKARTEFSVTLAVPASVSTATQSAAATWYRFEYREASGGPSNTPWDPARTHAVDAKPSASEVLLDDLNPTSTYEVRIFTVTRDAEGKELLSEPSEVAAVDTEVPGCGPDTGKCVIM
ncbi:hypothetical protein PybrP1_010898 [[Pythium] brassicae (nom. inval.)]|nr:hypothetical protein PybrP1_010898 [[Pythium] brassicae (nom. inval.)]